MTALKPCPFCGGDAEVGTWRELGKVRQFAHCRTLSCIGNRYTTFSTAAPAIRRWNRRAADVELAELRARVAELGDAR